MNIKCVQCKEVKELTSDNFYTRKGIFDTSRCKLCYRNYQSASNRRRRLVPTPVIDDNAIAELQCSICRTKKPGTRIFFRNIEEKTSIICWSCWDSRPTRERKEPTSSGAKLMRSIVRSVNAGKIDPRNIRSLDEIGIIIKR